MRARVRDICVRALISRESERRLGARAVFVLAFTVPKAYQMFPDKLDSIYSSAAQVVTVLVFGLGVWRLIFPVQR